MGQYRCGCVRFMPWCLSLILTVLSQAGGQRGDRSVRTEGRSERSDPLTVGRPPVSSTAWRHAACRRALSGGSGGAGRSAVKGGPGLGEQGTLEDGRSSSREHSGLWYVGCLHAQ
jgi:hypothetical protein